MSIPPIYSSAAPNGAWIRNVKRFTSWPDWGIAARCLTHNKQKLIFLHYWFQCRFSIIADAPAMGAWSPPALRGPSLCESIRCLYFGRAVLEYCRERDCFAFFPFFSVNLTTFYLFSHVFVQFVPGTLHTEQIEGDLWVLHNITTETVPNLLIGRYNICSPKELSEVFDYEPWTSSVVVLADEFLSLFEVRKSTVVSWFCTLSDLVTSNIYWIFCELDTMFFPPTIFFACRSRLLKYVSTSWYTFSWLILKSFSWSSALGSNQHYWVLLDFIIFLTFNPPMIFV